MLECRREDKGLSLILIIYNIRPGELKIYSPTMNLEFLSIFVMFKYVVNHEQLIPNTIKIINIFNNFTSLFSSMIKRHLIFC